jgi:hypothetical protein
MEQAIFISKVEDLKYCHSRFSRLYFGNEFCEQLIPCAIDLDRVLAFVSHHDLDLTFVSPYVTDRGLHRLEGLLGKLAEKRPNSEVVFNDYGVLRILKARYSRLKPVMGRLLNRMKRGPRLMMVIDKLPRTTVEYFRRSNLTVPILCRFLNRNGVKRVELDNVLQGIGFALDRLEGSLYVPFAYVTTTRLCLVNSCDKPEREEMIGIFPCGKECRKYTFYLRNPIMPVTLIRKGNTIFLVNGEVSARLEEKGINRLVVQPVIPM